MGGRLEEGARNSGLGLLEEGTKGYLEEVLGRKTLSYDYSFRIYYYY